MWCSIVTGRFVLTEAVSHAYSTVTTAVVHAEANAIMHKTCISLKGCRIYTTLFPCNECAKLIVQSGITEVYYLREHDKPDKLSMQASRHLLSIAGYDLEKESSLGDASNPTDQQPSKGSKPSKWVETGVVAVVICHVFHSLCRGSADSIVLNVRYKFAGLLPGGGLNACSKHHTRSNLKGPGGHKC